MTRAQLFKSGNFTVCADCIHMKVQGITPVCRAYPAKGIGQIDWMTGSQLRFIFKPCLLVNHGRCSRFKQIEREQVRWYSAGYGLLYQWYTSDRLYSWQGDAFDWQTTICRVQNEAMGRPR